MKPDPRYDKSAGNPLVISAIFSIFLARKEQEKIEAQSSSGERFLLPSPFSLY